MLAVGADPAQAVAAAGADDPVLVDGTVAVGALSVRGHLGQHGLLGEHTLVDLRDGLLGPDDAVEQQAEEEEDRGEEDDGQGRHRYHLSHGQQGMPQVVGMPTTS